MWREAARYEPRMGADERESCSADWARAVERAGLGPERRDGRRARVTAVAGGVGPTGAGTAGTLAMADIKPQVYKDPRPRGVLRTASTSTSRTHRPGLDLRRARGSSCAPVLVLYRRAGHRRRRTCPPTGPVIVAPNHFSNMDHFFAGVYLRRKMQFMAKSQLFGNPILNYIFRLGGVFPVRRGHHDEEAFKTAHTILDRGNCVLMYCEGGRSRTGGLGEARPGVGRIALRVGRPGRPGARSTARWACAGGASFASRRSPSSTASRSIFDVVSDPTREQQLEAAQRVFELGAGDVRRRSTSKGRSGVIKSLKGGRDVRPAGLRRQAFRTALSGKVDPMSTIAVIAIVAAAIVLAVFLFVALRRWSEARAAGKERHCRSEAAGHRQQADAHTSKATVSSGSELDRPPCAGRAPARGGRAPSRRGRASGTSSPRTPLETGDRRDAADRANERRGAHSAARDAAPLSTTSARPSSSRSSSYS